MILGFWIFMYSSFLSSQLEDQVHPQVTDGEDEHHAGQQSDDAVLIGEGRLEVGVGEHHAGRGGGGGQAHRVVGGDGQQAGDGVDVDVHRVRHGDDDGGEQAHDDQVLGKVGQHHAHHHHDGYEDPRGLAADQGVEHVADEGDDAGVLRGEGGAHGGDQGHHHDHGPNHALGGRLLDADEGLTANADDAEQQHHNGGHAQQAQVVEHSLDGAVRQQGGQEQQYDHGHHDADDRLLPGIQDQRVPVNHAVVDVLQLGYIDTEHELAQQDEDDNAADAQRDDAQDILQWVDDLAAGHGGELIVDHQAVAHEGQVNDAYTGGKAGAEDHGHAPRVLPVDLHRVAHSEDDLPEQQHGRLGGDDGQQGVAHQNGEGEQPGAAPDDLAVNDPVGEEVGDALSLHGVQHDAHHDHAPHRGGAQHAHH